MEGTPPAIGFTAEYYDFKVQKKMRLGPDWLTFAA
jgi:hypothetical protein